MSGKLITFDNLKDFRNNLSDVAVTGDYSDINNTPTYPSELEIRRMFRTEYTITGNITNGSLQETDPTIWSKETAIIHIIPDSENYNYPTTVTVVGSEYTYDSTTGVVSLSNPTGAVSITAVCEAEQPPVPVDLTSFSENDNVIGIVVDTTKTDIVVGGESMTLAAYVQSIMPSTSSAVEPLISLGTDVGISVTNQNGVAVLLCGEADGSGAPYLIYTTDTSPVGEAGWYKISGSTSTAITGNEGIAYLSDVKAVGTISSDFAPLNGTVFGEIEALDMFVQGDDFTQIQINPNLTPEWITAIATKAEALLQDKYGLAATVPAAGGQQVDCFILGVRDDQIQFVFGNGIRIYCTPANQTYAEGYQPSHTASGQDWGTWDLDTKTITSAFGTLTSVDGGVGNGILFGKVMQE